MTKNGFILLLLNIFQKVAMLNHWGHQMSYKYSNPKFSLEVLWTKVLNTRNFVCEFAKTSCPFCWEANNSSSCHAKSLWQKSIGKWGNYNLGAKYYLYYLNHKIHSSLVLGPGDSCILELLFLRYRYHINVFHHVPIGEKNHHPLL